MDEISEYRIDQPQKPKGRIAAFLDKWIFAIIIFSLSIFCFGLGIFLTYMHYPELSELEHYTGGLKKYSVIDSYKNHKITMVLESGDVFVFNKVDFFPAVKKVIATGKQIDIWVERTKSAGIWQLSIDDIILMSRDARVGSMRGGISSAFKWSLFFFVTGGVFVAGMKSENAFVVSISTIFIWSLYILCVGASLYFAFFHAW